MNQNKFEIKPNQEYKFEDSKEKEELLKGGKINNGRRNRKN